VDPGSGSVTSTIKAATAGQEQQVELAVSGATVNIPLGAMGSSQKVNLASVSAAATLAESPAPAGAAAASEGLSLALTPALEVALSFVVTGLVSTRREAKVYRVHWLDKKSNNWNVLCTEHTTDTATQTVTAVVPKWVQEEEGFNPSSGCAAGVTQCDGKGGTLIVFALDAEPDCSSGLDPGAIAGIVIGSVAGAGLLAFAAYMGVKKLRPDKPQRYLQHAEGEGLGRPVTGELAFSATPSVRTSSLEDVQAATQPSIMYSHAGQEIKV
jgi:hypothetical protein